MEATHAARILEASVGVALGPAPDLADSKRTDLDPSLTSEGSRVNKDGRYKCRLMYQYLEAWEPALNDDEKLSRQKVSQLIEKASLE